MSYSDQVSRYQQLRREGYSGPQAAEMVWGPGGLQSATQGQQREAGRKGQGQAIGQVAGTVGGVYVGREGYDYLFPAKEAAKETTTGLIKGTETVGTTTGQATGQAAQGLGQPSGTFEGMFTSQPANNLYTPIQDPSLPSGMTRVNVQSGVDGSNVQAVVPTDSLGDKGFLDSVNWNQVGQGTIGAMQLYQAYNAYKGGDKVGAGVYGTAGAANVASAAGANLPGYVVPGLNVAAGLYTGYKTAEMLSDTAAGSQRTKQGALGGAAAGASIGSVFGPWGAAIGAGVGGLAGAVGSWTGSSKGKAQFMRDNIRGVLQQGGVLDQNYKGTLADGSLYDFGKDGSTLKWKEIDKVAEKNPASWGAAVNLADALATGYGFVGQKASDIAAWYAKAAVSNANDDVETAKQNVRHFAQQQGFTYDLVKSKLDEALADNRVNQDQYNRYVSGAQDLFSGQATPGVSTLGSQPIQRDVPRASPDKVKKVSFADVAKGKVDLSQVSKGKR